MDVIMLEESGLPAPSVDPAVRPVRRTYPAEYRARVLAEYEAAAHGGEVRGVATRGNLSDPGVGVGQSAKRRTPQAVIFRRP